LDIKELCDRAMRFMEMSPEDQKQVLLNQAKNNLTRSIDSLKDCPTDYFRVYGFCKSLNELCELEGVDFKRFSLVKKIKAVRDSLSFVDQDVIFKGVREFHESAWCKGDSA